MANLLISADSVTVKLTAVEKAEALHGNVTVPRSAITASRVAPDGLAEIEGIRTAGTGVPGAIKVGTWRGSQRTTFAVCHGRKPAVVLDLTGEHFDRIVLTIGNPEDAVASLR